MIKLTIIKTNPEWLEAAWVEEITTKVEVEKEIQIETDVDGEVVITTEIVKELEDKIEAKILWCESYSGHREHIQILRNKALELETDLAEFEDLIKKVEEAFVYPTDEEIVAEELRYKLDEAKIYLANTDYKMTIDYYDTMTTEEKVEITTKRAEAREFIRANK